MDEKISPALLHKITNTKKEKWWPNYLNLKSLERAENNENII